MASLVSQDPGRRGTYTGLGLELEEGELAVTEDSRRSYYCVEPSKVAHSAPATLQLTNRSTATPIYPEYTPSKVADACS